jgi:hypothetical protein
MANNDHLAAGQPQAAFLHAANSAWDEMPSPEDVRQVAKFGVSRDGPDFAYRGYRYEQLHDALAYARIASARVDEEDEPEALPHTPFTPPTDAERLLMGSLGIQFDGRAFRFGGFRYDRLADAVNSARRANGPD